MFSKCKSADKSRARAPIRLSRSTVTTIALLLLAGGPAAVAQPSAQSQGFNALNLQLLRGSGYELGRETASIITGEWANAWRYGENFAFVDVSGPGSGDSSTYAKWMPRFSVSRLVSRNFSAGPIQDLFLAANAEFGEDFTNLFPGVGISLTVPGFNFVKVNSYLRDTRDLPGSTMQMNLAWNATFATGVAHWEFGGFLDWNGAEGNAGSGLYRPASLLMQPQLMLDVGRFFDSPDRLYAGIEWQYWRNKYGVRGITESVPQLGFKLKF